MKPIPVLGIPHYNRPDLLARCIASIDHPVEKLVIVQNGLDEDMISINGCAIAGVDAEYETVASGVYRQKILGKFRSELIGEIAYISHPNAGVAGAWNEIIKLFPASWWLISNNDIQFTPRDLEKMASCAEQRALTGKIYGNHGASWFVITRYGVDQVGLFDENIYPAYLEDCDWSYRADLLKVERFTHGDVHAIHGDATRNIKGSTTIYSDPELARKNQRTHGGNFDYYKLKWGGINERETFKTPFNDPAWPIWAWKFNPAHRAEQQW